MYKGRKGGEYKLSGSGEMDLLIKCMATKQEDTSVDSQNTCKTPALMVHICNFSIWEADIGGFPQRLIGQLA